MNCFLESANFPQNKVTHIIMSDKKIDILNEVRRLGLSIIVSGFLPSVAGSESYHADMSVCHLGKEKIVIANNMNINTENALLQIHSHLIKTKNTVTAKNPWLNVCMMGKRLIGNTKKMDQTIIDYIQQNEIQILHTNQAYTKCSSAVIDENALITADESIYKVCLKNQIDVLKISVGNIGLQNYPYGFIGGTCGKFSKHILAFSGNIKLHPDYANIKAFAANYGIYLLSLGKDELYDIGGLIPIKECEQ